jgi:nanoRNase/pAp phosphatase (c-di-AMP/oligoRNAs hydrolase)
MENRVMARLLKIPARKFTKRDLMRHDHVALVDTQPSFENNPFPKGRKASIIVDQHRSVSPPAARLSIIDPDCGATSVILSRALLRLKIDIPVNLATALSYGILSDTMNLYRAEQPHIGRTYLDILPYCDFGLLAKIQNPSRSRHFFVTMNRAVYQAMIRRRLIVSHLGAVSTPDLISQAADFLLTYQAVRWAFVTGRCKEKLHVSFRVARPNVDAGEILRSIFPNRRDAGGHGTIGGGSLKVAAGGDDAKWQDAEQGIVEKLVRRLRLPAKSTFYYPFRKT